MRFECQRKKEIKCGVTDKIRNEEIRRRVGVQVPLVGLDNERIAKRV